MQRAFDRWIDRGIDRRAASAPASRHAHGLQRRSGVARSRLVVAIINANVFGLTQSVQASLKFSTWRDLDRTRAVERVPGPL
ncbi:MAG TPA: hypothetical protein VFK02_02570 [Kofleriaceae bacterium]|nr:hypothetical protein [Kofleriaceae bacterium]